ncbi:uncharacterized protein LOC105703980 [Orussus abietinus]|uniref:uncharacterized protein LOC105703980 n=1 Tax=Orussus abietinus TaxID=222816 RepID=UPI000C7162CC|nr:uncharacterized protein LOC105703980 [Orussus abietinus]
MPPSLAASLSPLLLLIVAGSADAFSSRQAECTFPVRWEGTWFQSGVPQPILISGNTLSSKGRCRLNEGDKFLIEDEKQPCYRCVVIHEKHSNVLQYKETFCYNIKSLSPLCSYISGDAPLYSMFREEGIAMPCPFRGPMTFSYNRGHGTCASPQSNVDTCTDDSRLLFRYQACPDVHASESAVEELECLATWKEGSSRYLVGRLHHRHASSNEDRYRCFVYERAGQIIGNLNRPGLGINSMDHDVPLPIGPLPEGAPEIYKVAQSGDATCNGLFSPNEGSKTMTLKKVSSPGKCRFPSWLTGHSSGGLTWHTLDLARSYTFHPRNASLHISRPNATNSRIDVGQAEFPDLPEQQEQDVKILCNSVKQSNPAQTMATLVAHFTVGCRSGFMCMTFYRRDGHVIEVQTGSAVSRPEEACSSPHYTSHSIPFLTLVTSSPEPRQCPYLGKFTVTGMNKNQRSSRDNRRGPELGRKEKEKVRHAQERSEERHNRKLEFEVDNRRINSDYLTREHRGRKTRSSRNGRNHREYKADRLENDVEVEVEVDHEIRKSRSRRVRSLPESSNSQKSNLKHPALKNDIEVGRKGRKSRSRRIRSLQENLKTPEISFKNRSLEDEVEAEVSDTHENHGSRSRRIRALEVDLKGSNLEVENELKGLQRIESSGPRPLDGGEGSDVDSTSSEVRQRRSPRMEDFQLDKDDLAQLRQLWPSWIGEEGSGNVLQVQADYFGDYDVDVPTKRSSPEGAFVTYRDLLRMRRDLEDEAEDYLERREKREEEDSRCSSDVTTLIVGCSTADRMELQSDCVDDDTVTAYSCHGRWFDAEGTQFVIATPLARRSSWSNENNRPQPFRNSRRLCFMYRESGGVVSLTASPIACQRGIPPPPPMLAFNATSIGQCMEENGAGGPAASCTLVLLFAISVAIFR